MIAFSNAIFVGLRGRDPRNFLTNLKRLLDPTVSAEFAREQFDSTRLLVAMG